MPTFISNKNISVPEAPRPKPLSAPLRFNFDAVRFLKPVFESRVPDQALADFFDHLTTLLVSGITLVSALEFIHTSVRHPKLKPAVERISSALRSGEAFSYALEAESEIFDGVVIGMVRAAEASGRLEAISQELAASFTRRAEIKSQVLQAVAYPALVAVFGFLTVCVLMVFVIPKISTVFELWDTPLPLMTRFLLGVSHFMQHWGLLVLTLLAAGIFFLKYKVKTAFGKITASFAQKVPFVKDIFFLSDFVRLTRTWGMLLRSGVPILEAIRSSKEVLSSAKMRASLETISEKTLRGARLQEAIQDEPWMPDFAKNFLLIGEETGTLDDSFDKIAHFYERELKAKLKLMSTFIEPLFILAVGLSVGLLVISLLLPIFEMSLVVQ